MTAQTISRLANQTTPDRSLRHRSWIQKVLSVRKAQETCAEQSNAYEGYSPLRLAPFCLYARRQDILLAAIRRIDHWDF